MASYRITNLSSSYLQHPSEGILRFRIISRINDVVSSSIRHRFNFNPLVELRSPDTALSFVSASLTAAVAGGSRQAAGNTEISCIAAFAFNQFSSRNWLYGASISVELEEQQPPRPQAATPGAIEFVYGDYIRTLELQISELNAQRLRGNPVNHDHLRLWLELQISELNAQRLRGNPVNHDHLRLLLLQKSVLENSERLTSNQEDEECCSICLEGFRRGDVVTKLCPCSHKFHNVCIARWLCNNRTCPTCCTRCV